MKHLILSLLFLFLGNFLFAEISLLDVNSAGASNCEAEITVRATGPAGPFTVEVHLLIGSGSFVLATLDSIYTDVYGDFTLIDRCNDHYGITIYPTAYPSCSKYFTVDMPAIVADEQNTAPASSPTGPDARALPGVVLDLGPDKLLVEAIPNPSSGPVTITVLSGAQDTAEPSKELEVTLLTGTGAAVQHFRVLQTGTTTTFPLPGNTLRSGTYLVQVRTDNGQKEGVCRLVVQ